MDRTNSFGYWLRRRRKALDMTQAELAVRLSCSLDLIQKIESDARRPSRQLAEKLADCLAVPAAERDTFVQAARAERAADRLDLPSHPIDHVAELPQGTVTFLVTDIEGSSRLWDVHRQVMSAAVARHDALLSACVAEHGGVVFKTVGDGVLAAFASAPQALAAALAVQRAVSRETWSLPTPLRVRVALHSGSAEVRGGDYFGPTLNRAARLLTAGYGGQVLLSLASEQLVREHMPAGVRLRDLGRHWLKGFSLPERVFQLVADDLPATFPALHTPEAQQTNLPAQLTPLLGREQEHGMVTALLGTGEAAGARLVTLTGPGGVGKTRLALEIAADLLDCFADGVYFVDLSPVRDPGQVLTAIAHVLGVRETGGQSLLASLKDDLRHKHVLLVLDNFEQVSHAAPLVSELLAAAPALTLLVTSREALRLRGEKEVVVMPLALPDRAAMPAFDQLEQYAAVALFVQRARDSQADFQITNTNAPAVAEICVRLDGLPLAIELAAARVKLLPPAALLGQLRNRLAMLSGGPRDLPARQQTMRNTIAWSYALLTEAEQMLFRRLGVFVGGFMLEAVAGVCSPDGAPSVELLEGLAALTDKSLLRHSQSSGGTVRFVMLETIREFAAELLEASDEAGQIHRRHADYYRMLNAEEEDDSDDEARLRLMNPEYDNLRSALTWSHAVGDPVLSLELSRALTRIWWHRGLREEMKTELERVLSYQLGPEHRDAQTDARWTLGMLLGLMGYYSGSRNQFEYLLALAREQGNLWQQAYTLERLGWLAREQGDTATAWPLLRESLAMFREQQDWVMIAAVLNTSAEAAIMEEDLAQAEALLEESWAAVRQLGTPDLITTAWTLNHMGHVAQLRGEYARAAERHEEALGIFVADHYHAGMSMSYQGLGEAMLGLGRLDEATEWLLKGLALCKHVSDKPGMVWCLVGLGSTAAMDEEPEQAVRLWAAAERLRQSIGCRPAPAARPTYERAQAIVRAQLGEVAWATAWEAGQNTPLEHVIADVLGR